MQSTEFIELKNMMDICKFYDPDRYYNIFIVDQEKDINYLAARLLITIFCELESQNKYPKSSELNDLITFVKENPEAKKLKKYLNDIPGYVESLYCNQKQETYYQHRISLLGLNELQHRSGKFSDFKKYFKTDNIRSLYIEEHNNRTCLHASVNGSLLKVEKLYGFKKTAFKINNIVFDHLKVHELVNIINYSNLAKSLKLEDINATHYLLR